MVLSRKLKALRKKQGLSQLDVSEKLSVSRQAVSSWEAGASKPSVENLHALSNLYHVSIEYLLDDTQEQFVSANTEGAAKADTEKPLEGSDVKKWQRHKRVFIAAFFFVLFLCVAFLYIKEINSNSNQNNYLQDELEVEKGVVPDEDRFDLTWND